jgi:hypothetical protein
MNLIYLTPQLWQTEEVNDLTSALVAFQQAFDKVSLKKDANNPHYNKQYLSLDNLINTVRPLLASAGLTIVQDLAGDYLTTVIYHISGQFRGSAMPFSPTGRGQNAMQDLGGSITYAKRYALGAALSISVDTDDDANSAKTTQEEIKQKPKEIKPIQKKKITNDEEWRTLQIWVNEDLSRVDVALKSYELTAECVKVLQNMSKPK